MHVTCKNLFTYAMVNGYFVYEMNGKWESKCYVWTSLVREGVNMQYWMSHSFPWLAFLSGIIRMPVAHSQISSCRPLTLRHPWGRCTIPCLAHNRTWVFFSSVSFKTCHNPYSYELMFISLIDAFSFIFAFAFTEFIWRTYWSSWPLKHTLIITQFKCQ